ncbi:MAG: CPBP family intramembrane metalloprotease [Fimbriimonadaceae bacterium]|nr:CPBP family intramembrane metalloprotease [Fimbriimonadaceae bacterium]
MRGVLRPPLVLVFVGFLALYGVLNVTATMTRSNYGEGGAIVGTAVLAALVVIQYFLFRQMPVEAMRESGVVRPLWPGMRASLLITCGLLIVLGTLAFTFAASAREAWGVLAIGLALQGGLSEELVFRGFLFRKLRVGRTFWAAAWLSTVPFVFAHLYLFLLMDPIVATAATLTAVSTSFPMARLFELGGNAIWPPAIVHFATHLIKLLILSERDFALAQLIWMGCVCVLPWAAFLAKAQRPDLSKT